MSEKIVVWDRPVRIFHWGFALAILSCWITAGDDDLGTHRFFGFVATALLIFRIIWGVIGSDTARFSQFVRSPAEAVAVAKGAKWAGWGHNPLAGFAVLALMAAGGYALLTGLAAPVDGSGGAAAEAHAFSWTVLSALIVLHIVSIFAYRALRNEDLLGPMVGGLKAAPEGAPPAPVIREGRLALIAGGAAVAVAAALFGFDPG